MADTAKSSPEYAMLPAGTVVKYGPSGASESEFKPLVNCKALGATGLTGSFIDCTTLIDTAKQFISDLPEGPEKTLGFIDDPTNQDFMDFLEAARNRETVQFYIELPNGRVATMILALSGWQVNEITAPASEVIQITVNGKQNNIEWSVKGKDDSAGKQASSVSISIESGEDSADLKAEGALLFTAVPEPDSAECSYTWTSSNPDAAAFPKDATGATATLTWAGEGETTVTAVAVNSDKSKTPASNKITVTAQAAE